MLALRSHSTISTRSLTRPIRSLKCKRRYNRLLAEFCLTVGTVLCPTDREELMRLYFLTLVATLALVVSLHAADAKPVKIFILAGQSNMEGKAKLSLCEYQAQQPATAELFKHWRQGDKWIERDDVWIKFL